MTWIPGDLDDDEFIKELTTYPDRIVGLLTPAIVDKCLDRAIKSRWTDTADGDLFRDLFRDGGPLGSFATRIHIGFAIRIYGKEAYDDLRSLNKIRNAFAHKVAAKDFNDDSIRNYANKLSLPAKYPASSNDALISKLSPMLSSLDEAGRNIFNFVEVMAHHATVADPIDARSKFIRTCEILCWFLRIEGVFPSVEKISGFPPLPPAPRF
jgi:DNA-binding MltR family transcriptional regulator